MSTLVLQLLLLVLFIQDSTNAQSVDRTRQPRAAGTDVVFSSVSIIEDSEIFPQNNRFLRRLAYVETRDGVDISTYRDGYFGGIWQVDEAIFNKTLDTTTYPELLDLYTQILAEFSVDWSMARWENLLAPFFSALAAQLYLTTVTEAIPPAGNLQAQGQYWLDHYSDDPSDTVQLFVDNVNEFELEECPIRGLDLAFVFDSSGSVGRANFELEKQFAIDVTNTFNIGPDDTRIANIAYSGFSTISFFFDTFGNRSTVTEALGDVVYSNMENPPGSRRGTNTAGALIQLRDEVFTVERGAREPRFGIPRVAVVITDGRSNVNPTETVPAAQRLEDDGVIVFAVGVGSRINMAELRGIASAPQYVILLSNFDVTEFATLQRTISAEACTVPAPIDIAEDIEGVLFDGDLSFFEFLLPTSGMTLRLEGQSGRTVMYASSKITNPNSAFHDYRYDSRTDAGGLFVSPDMPAGNGRKKRTIDVISANFTNTTLYVSIQGLEERNEFTLLTTFGNTSSSNKLMAGLSTMIALLMMAFASLL